MTRDLQFDGKLEHDPNQHVENFLDICELFKNQGASNDAVRLRIFPFTLIGDAKAWLKSLEPNSITTWEDLRSKFVTRYFPPARAEKIKNDIMGFQQDISEPITEAWERFKRLTRMCPHHGLTKSNLVQIFYRGIDAQSRGILDSSSGGVFMYKTPAEGFQLLEDMAIHTLEWITDRRGQVKRGSVNTIETEAGEEVASLRNNQKVLERKINELTSSLHAIQVGCEVCKGPHLTKDCETNRPMMTPEEVNYMENNRNYGGWNNQGNNRNFGYQRQGPPGFYKHNQGFPPKQDEQGGGQPKADSMEDLLKQFISSQSKMTTELQNRQLASEQAQRNQQAAIQNLERDVGKIAQTLSERQQGGLPSNTQKNPRPEQILAITTRSGKQVSNPNSFNYLANENSGGMQEIEKEVAAKDGEKKDEGETVSTEALKAREYKPRVPFPQRLRKEKMKEKYAKFVDMVKQVHINVPLVDMLSVIPNYGKFLKELVTGKTPVEKVATVLNEECSAVLQATQPPEKRGDPGSFTIPCFVGNKLMCDALADLGASINLMPLSVYSKLGLGDLKATRMTLQLADRSFQYPLGIAENVPVKVGKFVFPTDFVILDIDADEKVPLILGRPFLYTADAVIHVSRRELNLGVGTERVTFSLDKALKYPATLDDTCLMMGTFAHEEEEVTRPP